MKKKDILKCGKEILECLKDTASSFHSIDQAGDGCSKNFTLRQEIEVLEKLVEEFGTDHIDISQDIQCTNNRVQSLNKDMQCMGGEIRNINKGFQYIRKDIQCTNNEAQRMNKDIQCMNEEIQNINKEFQCIRKDMQYTKHALSKIIREKEEDIKTLKRIIRAGTKESIKISNENHMEQSRLIRNTLKSIK